MRKLAAALTAISVGALWTSSAFAGFWDCPPPKVPEIDGPAGLAAIALVMSIGAVLYRKFDR